MSATDSSPPALLLYDGECGLCDRSVQLVLRRDRAAAFQYAPLQGETAAPILARYGVGPGKHGFESMLLLENRGGPGERLLEGADAVLAVLRGLGRGWALLSCFARLVPGPLRRLAYRWVARSRHRFFAAPTSCRVPQGDERQRFLP